MDIQEKANAYDEALERARKVLNTPYIAHWDKHKELIEHIFPELAESKGEKIRNFLIDFIKVCGWTEKEDQGWPLREDVIALLEKQGEHQHLNDNFPSFDEDQGTIIVEKKSEQKPYGQRAECSDCQMNYAGECKGNCELKRNEHKAVVTRKFKVGDIVQYITDSTDRRRIEEVDELCNMYRTNDSPIMFEIEDEWKLVVKNKELEEAADDYAVKVYNDFLKDKTTLDSKEGDEILIEAFRAGAEWQMKYNESTEARSIS